MFHRATTANGGGCGHREPGRRQGRSHHRDVRKQVSETPTRRHVRAHSVPSKHVVPLTSIAVRTNKKLRTAHAPHGKDKRRRKPRSLSSGSWRRTLCAMCHSTTLPCRHCRITKCIGVGTFGRVFRVLVGERQEPYALKVMHTAADGDDIQLVHHTALVEIHRATTVPGILAPQSAWVIPENHALAVLFPLASCNAQELCSLLPPSLPAVAFVTAAITRTLAAMHGRGFMHRDLTARNILIMHDGDVMLCDRSLVRRLWGNSVRRGCYTPTVTALAYRAPEVLVSRETPLYDERVDVWALGCVVAELLTQDLLFEFSDVQRIQQLAAVVRVAGGYKWPTAAVPANLDTERRINAILQNAKQRNDAVGKPAHGTAEDIIRRRSHLRATTEEDAGLFAEAIDFVRQCLCVDPAARASADALLSHPFCARGNKTAVRQHVLAIHSSPPTAEHDEWVSLCHLKALAANAVSTQGCSGASGPPSPSNTAFNDSHGEDDDSHASSGSANKYVTNPVPPFVAGFTPILRQLCETGIQVMPMAAPRVFTRHAATTLDTTARNAMVRMAGRLLWPSTVCSPHGRPAGWTSFATAMFLFDHTMMKPLPPAIDPMLLHLAICVLVSTRDCRMHAITSRMNVLERSYYNEVGQRRLKDVVVFVLRSVRCNTNPATVVDDALSAEKQDATACVSLVNLPCVAAALHSCATPYFWDARATLLYCRAHVAQIYSAFETIVGFHPVSGESPLPSPLAVTPFLTHLVVGKRPAAPRANKTRRKAQTTTHKLRQNHTRAVAVAVVESEL